jgi:hypothetical protein
MDGSGPARSPKKKKTLVGPTQPVLRLSSAQPIYIYIYIYIDTHTHIIFKNKKNFKGHFKIFVIFSNVCQPILLNIALYTYTVRYKSSIKIPDFFQKNFKNIFKKIQKK